ncbi:MAG: glycosyltransferase family 39 protein [Candidatus Kapaibacterium sp.]
MIDIDNKMYKGIWKYFIVAALILLPTLAFPIASDLSVFMHGGSIIANGGYLFQDFYDIKPPFIYYLFAAINFLFGDNLIAFRLFDFFYQLTFLVITSYLMFKLELKTKVIKAFLIIFPLSYTILNYRDIFQTESLAFIPLILYFYYLIIEDNSYKKHLIMGTVLGIAIALKYTLGIIFIGYIVYFFSDSKKRDYTKAITQLIIAIFVVVLTFVPVLVTGGLDGFLDTNSYLAEYAKYPPIGAALAKQMIDILTHNFGTLVSVSTLFFFLLASLLIKDEKLQIMKKYLLLFCFLLFLSVLLERKINMYHITRLYPYYIIIISLGLVYFIEKYRFRFNLASFTLIALFLLMSPLLRFVNSYKIAFDRLFRYESYLAYYTNDKPFNILGHHIAIADYINKKGEEKFLFINTGGNQTIHYLNSKYKYKFPHSAFHLSPKAPASYKKAFEEDLKDANIIAIDSLDNIFMIFLTDGSSYDLFFKEKEYKDYLNNYFELDTTLLNRYFIYERKCK